MTTYKDHKKNFDCDSFDNLLVVLVVKSKIFIWNDQGKLKSVYMLYINMKYKRLTWFIKCCKTSHFEWKKVCQWGTNIVYQILQIYSFGMKKICQWGNKEV